MAVDTLARQSARVRAAAVRERVAARLPAGLPREIAARCLIKSASRPADAIHMEIVFSPGSVVLVSLVTGGWAALLCLKALGAELDYQRRLAKLMREARELRQAQEERRRRLHKSTMERLRPRIIAPAPVESDSPAEAQPETIGRVDPVAAPPLAQAA